MDKKYEVDCTDPDSADTSLNRPAVIQAITQRPRRRLVSQSVSQAENQVDNAVPLNVQAQRKILNNLTKILRKNDDKRTIEDQTYLKSWENFIAEAELRVKRSETLKQRAIEQEESYETVFSKSLDLVHLIKTSKSIVVYTGAGISTSASIPDYRGPNGLWTQLKKTGTFSITQVSNLTAAKPTFTHMALTELCKRKIISHIVSQNCDGLHLRSGTPRENLSEIHGNMYIEACLNCKRIYHRSIDVTERTSRFHHKTGRKCTKCRSTNNDLFDTIVLYGERNRHEWPMNWLAASRAARKSDLIICLGSSLKTLRLYDNLWPKSINDRQTKLAIVNLQYTSKDKSSTLKISGKCDDVMRHVMKHLGIDVPEYCCQNDPLRFLCVPLTDEEKMSIKGISLFEDISIIQTAKADNTMENSDSVSEINVDNLDVKMLIKLPQASQANDNAQTAPRESRTQDLIQSSSVVTNLPGWLGRGISRGSQNVSKRRKHGNRGKKRPKKTISCHSPNIDFSDCKAECDC